MFFVMPGIVVIMLKIFGYLYLNGQKRTLSGSILTPASIAGENGALVESQSSEGSGIANARAQAPGGLRNCPVEAVGMFPFPS